MIRRLRYLLAHVRDHGEHVVLGRADEGGAEDDGEVLHLHLVDLGARHHAAQVQHDELERLVVDLRQVPAGGDRRSVI